MILAAVLLVLWYVPQRISPDPDETNLWERVRSAQLHMSRWRARMDCAAPPGADPWGLGLIGVEWSPVTTTLGSLPSKRTACNPMWSVVLARWYTDCGLVEGDRIALFSSASFPGMLLNALAAAEQMKLRVLLVVSLGASTWGANHPACTWPVMERELRTAGFIRTRAGYYTLGGDGEIGEGMSPEGRDILLAAVRDAGVQLLQAPGLDEMVRLKFRIMNEFEPRVLVNIGGSHANLGSPGDRSILPSGLLDPARTGAGGTGVISRALRNGTPVIHLLNLKGLSAKAGVPFDTSPRKTVTRPKTILFSLTGIAIYLAGLLLHSRWGLRPFR